MGHHVRFESDETYLKRRLSNVLEDKGKKVNFGKACKPFSMLHGQLMYKNIRLPISFEGRQHTIISDVHKGVGHDPKAKEMVLHCRMDSAI